MVGFSVTTLFLLGGVYSRRVRRGQLKNPVSFWSVLFKNLNAFTTSHPWAMARGALNKSSSDTSSFLSVYFISALLFSSPLVLPSSEYNASSYILRQRKIFNGSLVIDSNTLFASSEFAKWINKSICTWKTISPPTILVSIYKPKSSEKRKALERLRKAVIFSTVHESSYKFPFLSTITFSSSFPMLTNAQ